MGRFAKRFLWFVVCVGLLYGGYRAYVAWWNEETFSSVKERVLEITRTTGDTVRGKATEKAREYASSVISETQDATQNYIREKAADALTFLGEKVISAAASLAGGEKRQEPNASTSTLSAVTVGSGGNVLPVATSSTFLVPPPPATIIAGVDTPLVFSINKQVSYSVDWGDGAREDGTIAPNTVRLVNHAWARAGDYSVRIVFREAGNESEEIFPVRVYGL